MAAPIPCLGYPSRTAAVAALRADGLTTNEIADKIGITPKIVQDLEYSAARQRGISKTCAIAERTSALLEQPAAKRGMSVKALAQAIIDTVARDRMVDAVLDDREAPHGL